MKALLITANSVQRKRMAGALMAAGHTVVSPATGPEIKAAVLKGDVTVALLDLQSGRKSGIVGALRKASPHHDVHVIAVLARIDNASVDYIHELGCDDMMLTSAGESEVVFRAEAPARRRQAAGGLSAAQDALDITRLMAWEDAETAIADQLGDLLGLTTTTRATPGARSSVGASVTLSCAAKEVECSLLIGVSAPDAQKLAKHLFGEKVPDDVMADAIREFANTAGGGFKRAALTEGALFTMGLPQDLTPGSNVVGEKCWIVSTETGIDFHLSLAQATSKVAKVPARSLREGMVLVNDVRAPNGALLIGSGTVLTNRSANRLLEMVGPTATFEIAVAA